MPVAVPVFSATATSLQTMVPPIFDPATGRFVSVIAGVQILQISGAFLTTSNIMPGLTITALPAVNAPAGSVTASYLNGGLNVVQSAQTAAALSPGLANLSVALSTFNANLAQLLPNVQSIVANPQQTVALTTPNGQPFVLNSTSLALLDQLIAAFIFQFVSSIPRGSPVLTDAQVSACPPSTGNASLDTALCSFQQFHQQLAQQSAQTVQQAAQTDTGFYLSFLGGWPAQGLGGSGTTTDTLAKAFALLWGTTTPYISAYTTASSPPPLSESLTDVGAKALDTYGVFGLPVPSANVTAFKLYAAAAQMATGTTSASPQGGVSVSSTTLGAPAGTNGVFGFRGALENTVDPRLAVPPTAGSVSTASATLSTPDVHVFDGSYAGSAIAVDSHRDGTTTTETFPLTASISGGNIAGSAIVPEGSIPFSGTVSPTGLVTFGLIDPGSGVPCTFGGKFQVSASGQASGSGNLSCPAAQNVDSTAGTWTVTRQ